MRSMLCYGKKSACDAQISGLWRTPAQARLKLSPPPSPLKSKAIAQKKYEKHRSRTKQAGEKGSGNA